MELAVRRRMISEVVAFDQIGPAVAFDSLTNSIARVLGPLGYFQIEPALSDAKRQKITCNDLSQRILE
jgi:hypothetical protein